MDNRLHQVRIMGLGLAAVYGLGLLLYGGVYLISFVSPELVLSKFLSGQFRDIEELRAHAIFVWLLFSPQFIAYLTVARFKEWGRQLVIWMNVVMFLYVLTNMIVLKSVNILSVFSVFICIVVIWFFNQRQIKELFLGSKVLGKPNKRILIVDDDKGLLKMLRASLMYSGYEVYTAATGEKGLQYAKSKKPDLIVLDVILPGIKGREVCLTLKENSLTKDIPVIFLTSKDSPDDVRAEMEVGAIAHLTKPVQPGEVLKEIKKILGA